MKLLNTLVVLFLTLTVKAQQNTSWQEKMIGTWQMDATMYDGSGAKRMEFKGNATWEKAYDGRYIKENFNFEVGGKKIYGEAFLGESKRFKRLEFVQVDNVNPAMFVLNGTYNDSLQNIGFNNVEGGIPLRWEYQFNTDGSFVKSMFTPKSDGTKQLQSTYLYRRK